MTLSDRIRADGTFDDLIKPVSLAIILHWIDFLIGFGGSAPEIDQRERWTINRIMETPEADIKNLIRNEIKKGWNTADTEGIGDVPRVLYNNDVLKVIDETLLLEILRIFDDYSLKDPDDRSDIREAYESLLLSKRRRDASLSLCTTPDSVGDLIIEIIDPKPDEHVYDPCFGTGDLLVKAVRHGLKTTDDTRHNGNSNSSAIQVFGDEIDPSLFLICLTRLILAGVNKPLLNIGDSLAKNGTNQKTNHLFDCIISHPPFGVRSDEQRKQWVAGRLVLDHIESAFLRHIMLSLKPGGRAAVLVPDRMLNRSGPDIELRHWLLEEFSVEGIVSVPPGALSSFSGIDSSLIFFRKAEPRKRIWYQKAQPVRHDESRITIDSNEEAERFRTRLPGDTCWFVPRRELLHGDFYHVMKDHGYSAIQHVLDTLSQSGARVSIKSLGELGKVFKGHGPGTERVSIVRGSPFKRVLGGKSTEANRPFLRSVDIGDGDIRYPTDTVFQRGGSGIRRDEYLKAGDLVVNRIGTVRKIAIVRENLDGAVPSSNVCVIRLSDMVPEYLRMVLLSEPYEAWIEEKAVGKGIRHISIRTLGELPVPIPTREHQQRLARNLPHRATADELLSLFLNEEEYDEIVSYIFGSVILSRLISDSENETFSDESTGILSLLSQETKSILTDFEGKNTPPKPIHEWFNDLTDTVDDLSDTLQLPPGAERLAHISEIRQRWLDRTGRIDDIDERYSQRVQRITNSLSNIMDQEIEELLSMSRLVAGIEPSMIEADKETEINVTIKNKGVLAMRRLSIKTSPVESEYEVPVLQAGQAVSWTAKVPPHSRGRAPIVISWRALRFDRTEMVGEIPLVIGVSDSKNVRVQKSLGASPYVVGRPVDSENDFFGRRDVIADIKRQIEGTGPSNLILFEGVRRSGKTSVLKYMIKQGLLEGWIPAYYSFQSGEGHTDKEGISTREIFRGMARDVILAILRAGYTAEIVEGENISGSSLSSMRTVDRALVRYFVDEQPFRSFEVLLFSVLERIRPLGLLLMLDEFDKLQISIDNGLASPQVPENLRSLFHAHENINAILTGSKRLKYLRNDYMSALFGLGYAIRLEPLNYEDSRRLIEEPVASDLIYVDSALEHIITWCAGQPFLIQSLCNRIFEYCARFRERIVQPGIVEKAANEMVRDNEHFRTLWDHIGSDKRRFILLVIHELSNQAVRVTHDALTARLEGYGVFPEGDESLGDSLAHLQELELVGYEGSASSGIYTLAVPLISLWLDTHIDFEDYRQRAQRELERV